MEQTITTKNQIPIYYYPNRRLHSFCICLYVKAGSLYETDAINGITHLWEHIAFRKLNKIYDGKFYQKLDSCGLSFQAATYKEFVSFKIIGSKTHFREAAKIISGIFEPVTLSAKEIEAEKKRIKAEIREVDEKSSLDYFSQKIVWKGTSLMHTIPGRLNVLDKLGIKALQRYQEETLAVENLFFYVTGAFVEKDIAFLKSCIENFQVAQGKEVRGNMAPVPENFFKRPCQIAVKNSSYHYIRISLDLDVTRYKNAEIDLLYSILFNGDTCKIYQELSEKTGYIYSYDAFLERYNNIGNLYFSFETQKKDILPAIQATIRVFKDLKEGITDELEFARPMYVDNAALLLDEPDDLNWVMAYENHILDAGYKGIEERRAAYAKITPERITQIAKEVFRVENLVITLKTDKKSLDEHSIIALMENL